MRHLSQKRSTGDSILTRSVARICFINLDLGLNFYWHNARILFRRMLVQRQCRNPHMSSYDQAYCSHRNPMPHETGCSLNISGPFLPALRYVYADEGVAACGVFPAYLAGVDISEDGVRRTGRCVRLFLISLHMSPEAEDQ
jgi:hypothetical protein